ncbi:MAG: RNA-binding cell elongation regulator Jag/EloR [Bacillota bacterium]|nr:protein jag [Clostridiales bacterium UBA9857]HOA71354.1 RNA-binding cell elongation regulator Jag/EloR [Bacillota bacterium]HOP70416.1 RNA-binding cell elongation regulator Jag/EloR [Bacillota bacterium]HPT36102.1 RNA-binding cell elongation regulator Jag/EloR [Bacillota bacterium]HQD86415.1 RNA-binding cell elongation regulator Jag/EloR [Bacillota bacterium]
MTTIETTGRTVEEALENALRELGVSQHDVIVEVIEEPSRGFLGIIGGRDARIRVTLKKTKAEIAYEFLTGLLQRMNIRGVVHTRAQGDTHLLTVDGEDLGILIGRHGQTLKHLEFLTNIVSSKGVGNISRIFVDVAGYRKRKEKMLEDLARSAARKVERTGRSTTLRPMDARDRRIIHLTLQKNGKVTTHSEGDEPFRRVVISPRKSAGAGSRQR